MKKKIKVIIVVACAIVLLIGVVLLCRIGGSEITDGVYEITDCSDFPNAYIEVTGNKLQFYEIDLNEIYQAAQIESYDNLNESGALDISEEKIAEISDLNNLLVSNPYELDYESITDNKNGTFTYIYYCMSEQNIFGLVLEYDSLHKTIQINSPVRQLVFEK